MGVKFSCGVYLIEPNETEENHLIEYERGQRPGVTRLTCLQSAIRRWEQEIFTFDFVLARNVGSYCLQESYVYNERKQLKETLMPIDPLHQYQELCNDCRSREASAWVIPTGSFTWTALVIQVLLNMKPGANMLVLSIINALVFSALFTLFARWTLYQLATQRAIQKLLKKREFSEFLPISQYMEINEEAFTNDGFVARFFARRSSTRYLYFVMSTILVGDIALTVWVLIKILQ